jgi:hypothetical protein
MSVREFAAHLGVSDRMVSKWESGGDAIHPRPLNQSALDTSLSLADKEIRNRFTNIISGGEGAPPGRRRAAGAKERRISDTILHCVRHPLDNKVMTMIDSGPDRVGPGRRPFWLPGFYIDIQPTSNAEYARFLAATGRRPPPHWPEGIYTIADDPSALHDEPVVNVSWDDANAYAYWSGKEVPSGLQWDRAYRGGEGMLIGDLWEWVRSEAGPGRRGHKGGRNAGFRCASTTTNLLTLLAI